MALILFSLISAISSISETTIDELLNRALSEQTAADARQDAAERLVAATETALVIRDLVQAGAPHLFFKTQLKLTDFKALSQQLERRLSLPELQILSSRLAHSDPVIHLMTLRDLRRKLNQNTNGHRSQKSLDLALASLEVKMIEPKLFELYKTSQAIQTTLAERMRRQEGSSHLGYSLMLRINSENKKTN